MPDYSQRLRALMVPQRDRQPVRAEMPTVRGDNTTAVIRLYDPIDSWGEMFGVSAKEFVAALDDLPDSVTEIRLLINSPGGEIFDATAIMNTLRRHKARVVAVVEGLAASSASVIACSADELAMAPNSELMIHRAWGLVVGNAGDMQAMAEDLEHFDRNLAAVYAAKAGGDIDDWLGVMERETWYSAEEAVAAGLADRVDDTTSEDDTAKAKARWDLSLLSIPGRSDASGSQDPAVTPTGGPRNPTGRSTAVAFSDEQMTTLRQRLNLADNADEAAILAAFDGVVAALEAAVEDDPAPAPTPAPVLPAGVSAIDTAQLEQLRNDAAAGREARTQQVAEHRERIVAAAVADGRIPPARRQVWLDQLAADPGAEEVLNTLAKGLVPVAELGAAGAADLDADTALYAELFGPEVKA